MSEKKKKRKNASDDEQAELEKQLSELSPEEAEMFARALELTLKKRRIMLIGHLAAVLAVVLGFLGALYYYGSQEGDAFIGWVFLVPVGVAGVILLLFGKLAKRVKK